MRSARSVRVGVLVALLLAAGAALPAEAQVDGEARRYTLEQLESLALQHNPTLRQAAAGVAVAEGELDQAGRRPNPSIGYELDDFTFRAPDESAQHWLLLEKPLLVGGKLGARKEVARRALAEARVEAEAQRHRVLAATRALFWEARVLDEQVLLHEALAGIADEAVEVTGGLMRTGAADMPDLLATRAEAARIHLDLAEARIQRTRVGRQLAAVVGDETLADTELEGALPEDPPGEAFDSALERLLADSPELRFAETELTHAEARIGRARAEGRPDLLLGAGLGWSQERLEGTDRRAGWQLRAGVTFELPVLDANQGEVAATRAFRDFAAAGVRRVEMSLRSRLAAVVAELAGARAALEAHRDEILPAASEAARLYRNAFDRMAAAYPQVLIAERDLTRARIAELDARGRVLRARVLVEAFLLEDGLVEPGVTGEPTMAKPAGVGHGQ